MNIYPAGSKVTFAGILMSNGKARLQANNPLFSIDIDLTLFEPLTITPPAAEIGDIVALKGLRFAGERYKLIGIDGQRAWVRNLGGLERFDIDTNDVLLVSRDNRGDAK